MFKRLLGARLPLPSVCAVCRSWNSAAVCAPCQQALGAVRARCPSCAVPLAPGLSLCAHCTEHGHGPIDLACARVDYQWPWNHLIQQWKFHQHSAWSAEWARHLVQDPQIVRALKEATVWIPIPLTPERLAERGFNQSWELIKHLHGLHPEAQLWPEALVRRHTEHLQHHLDRQKRLDHAQKALNVNTEYARALKGQRVMLVDDVMTTGATLFAAAHLLRQAGVARVYSVVIARTPPDTTRMRPLHPEDEASLST